MSDANQMLTVKEVAARWRVSTMTIYRLIRDGDLECIQIGNSFRIRLSAVEGYEKRHQTVIAP